MPMDRKKHEEILESLLDPSLQQSDRTELLQTLRVDYGSVLTDHSTHTEQIEKLNKDNSDLVLSNSKLFRQIGLTNNDDKKEDEKRTVSESITIEQIEKGMNN